MVSHLHRYIDDYNDLFFYYCALMFGILYTIFNALTIRFILIVISNCNTSKLY